jgi:hypothetical protein
MSRNDHLIILADKSTDWKNMERPEEDIDVIKSQLKKDIKQIIIPSATSILVVVITEKKDSKEQTDELLEKSRQQSTQPNK